MAVEKDATTLPTPAGQGWAQEEKLTGAAGWVRMQFLMIAMRSSRSATAMGSWHLQFAPTRPSTQHSNTPGAAGGNLFWLWKRPLGPLGAEELWKRLPCHETRALEKATGSTLLKSFGKGSPHGKRLWERPPTSAWEWLWKRVLTQILCTGLASPKWAGHDKLLTD